MMEQEERLGMILTWLNVSTAVYVRSRVQLMQLYRVRILNLQLKREKNFIIRKKKCLKTVIDGKQLLLRT